MSLIREQLTQHIFVRRAGEEKFDAEFALPADFAGFRGHFPGRPVMPGVCIIAAVLVCAESILAIGLKMTELKAAKFFSPVEPGDRVDIEGSIGAEGEAWRVRARLTRAGEPVARVSLVAVARQSEKGG